MIAAISEHRSQITWRGEIPFAELCQLIPPGQTPNRESLNAAIFRFFNRVEDEDSARLERLGYRLPSLSAGDLFTVEGVAFVVAGIGSERVSGNPRFVRGLVAWTLGR
jgi:hypothetical protein